MLKQAKVAFPDSASVKYINLKDRNGSLGAEVLKRFNVVFDYKNRKMTLNCLILALHGNSLPDMKTMGTIDICYHP